MATSWDYRPKPLPFEQRAGNEQASILPKGRRDRAPCDSAPRRWPRMPQQCYHPAKAVPKRLVSDATMRRLSRDVRAAAWGTSNTGRRTDDVDYGVAVVGIFIARRNCLPVSDRLVAVKRKASSRSTCAFRSGVASGSEQRRSELYERWRQFRNRRFDLGRNTGGTELGYRLRDFQEQAP